MKTIYDIYHQMTKGQLSSSIKRNIAQGKYELAQSQATIYILRFNEGVK